MDLFFPQGKNDLELNRSNESGYEQDGTPIKGNPSEFFGLGIVAFLDLLGFSRSVLNQWGDGEDSPLMKLFRIKDIPLIKRESGVSIGSYDIDQNKKVVKLSKYKVKVHTLSDSVTLSVALPAALTLGDFVQAFSCLALNIQFFLGAALNEGYVVRGAAEIDQIFWNEQEIVGPALIRAYNLERNSAKIARVILGPELLIQLATVCENDRYDWISLVRKNADGLISFDARIQDTRAEDIIKLRSAVADDNDKASKYCGLIDANNQPIQLPRPTIEQLRIAAKILNDG